MEQVHVAVRALDPITVSGLTNCLAGRPEIQVIPRPRPEQVDVVVAAFDRLSPNAVAALRDTVANVGRPIVLVIDEIQEEEFLTAVECRVVAILPRTAANDDRLVQTVTSAAIGGANIPSNLLGQLISHTERLHREVLARSGLSSSGLSNREIDVLRLMADGQDTNEIARTLAYSERTVKNIIYAITTRLHLRNRPHAVAYAMRAGVI